jgi:hypothetical protein
MIAISLAAARRKLRSLRDKDARLTPPPLDPEICDQSELSDQRPTAATDPRLVKVPPEPSGPQGRTPISPRLTHAAKRPLEVSHG